jgi:hypothetical protein
MECRLKRERGELGKRGRDDDDEEEGEMTMTKKKKKKKTNSHLNSIGKRRLCLFSTESLGTLRLCKTNFSRGGKKRERDRSQQ